MLGAIIRESLLPSYYLLYMYIVVFQDMDDEDKAFAAKKREEEKKLKVGAGKIC